VARVPVAGTSGAGKTTQVRFYDRFHHVVLSAPLGFFSSE